MIEAAADTRHDAVRTVIRAAALHRRERAQMRVGVAHAIGAPPEGFEQGALGARFIVAETVAPACDRVAHPHEFGGAEDGIDVRERGLHAILILLCEASADDELARGIRRLERLEMAEAPVGPLFGVIADRAGVHHDDVRFFGPADDRITGRRRAIREILRIGLVHLASERLDVDSGHSFAAFACTAGQAFEQGQRQIEFPADQVGVPANSRGLPSKRTAASSSLPTTRWPS